MNWRKYLWPLSIPYSLATNIRNYLFDSGRFCEFQFDVPVINVGNLSVGGSGKTPMVEFLIKNLSDRYTIAILSRGYKRKTKGFFIAQASMDAKDLGDEPFQYFRKFKDQVVVAVGEERMTAIPSILLERPDVNLIILDDAYQHRYVKPLFNILLSDANTPFFNDSLLPSGNLRESKAGAKRADFMIFTKCKSKFDSFKEYEKESSNFFDSDNRVGFTEQQYGELEAVTTSLPQKNEWLAFSGLANNTYFKEYINTNYKTVEFIPYGDHTSYSPDLVDSILKKARNNNCGLLTTEKDAVKWIPYINKLENEGIPLFFVPIEVKFIRGEKEFFSQLYSKLEVSSNNYE